MQKTSEILNDDITGIKPEKEQKQRYMSANPNGIKDRQNKAK